MNMHIYFCVWVLFVPPHGENCTENSIIGLSMMKDVLDDLAQSLFIVWSIGLLCLCVCLRVMRWKLSTLFVAYFLYLCLRWDYLLISALLISKVLSHMLQNGSFLLFRIFLCFIIIIFNSSILYQITFVFYCYDVVHLGEIGILYWDITLGFTN